MVCVSYAARFGRSRIMSARDAKITVAPNNNRGVFAVSSFYSTVTLTPASGGGGIVRNS